MNNKEREKFSIFRIVILAIHMKNNEKSALHMSSIGNMLSTCSSCFEKETGDLLPTTGQ